MKTELERHVRALSGVGSRYWNAPGFARAVDYAEERFRSWGYVTRRHEFEVGAARAGSCENLIADLSARAGRPEASEVIVGAHLDCISPEAAKGGPAPGADDNASGGAIVLEAARALAIANPEHRIRFVLFGAEEIGLYGSQAYVQSMRIERSRPRAVWILDQVGLQTRDSPTLKLEGYKGLSGRLMEIVEAVAPHAGLLTERTYRPYGSDHMPFLRAKIPTLLLIQPDDEEDPLNHTTGDTPDRLDYDYMSRILSLMGRLLAPTPPP